MGLRSHAERPATRLKGFHSGILDKDSSHSRYYIECLNFLQIIRLELMPDLLPGLKWHVQFCMRSPPSAVPVVPTAVVMIRLKILFFVSVCKFFSLFVNTTSYS